MNPFSRTVLLKGPIGIGKSTVARLIAFEKMVALLHTDAAKRRIRNIKWEGPGLIDQKSMSWYVEMPVTGFDDSLVSSQLLGHKKGAFTGAHQDSCGVFETASLGRSGTREGGPGLTGGIVFLDEIADIPLHIQAKLIPVLSGGTCYKLGGEGENDHEFSYHGVTIAASWKEFTAENIREDLFERLSGTVIEIPSLAGRSEDIPFIVQSIQEHLLEGFPSRFEEIAHLEPDLDQAHFEKLVEGARTALY